MLQLSARNIILLVVDFLLLFFIAFIFIEFPENYYLFPAAGLALIGALYILATKELAIFFAVPVCLLNLLLIEFAPENSAKEIFCSTFVVSVISFFIFVYAAKRQVRLKNIAKEIEQYDKKQKELAAECNEWKNSLSEAAEQARFLNTLMGMVKKIIEVLDINEVKKRLTQLIEEAFPGVRYNIKSGGSDADVYDNWVYQRKVSLLVEDMQNDSRFAGAGIGNTKASLLAAPIIVDKEIAEIIRLESDKIKAFNVNHLRIVELLSLMTSIAIDSIGLLSGFRDRAIHDGFTGLINHKYFLERLEQEILFAGRYKNNLGLIMLDIDHFKKFNDTYGHSAGDEVLKRLVKVICSRVRDVDIVARYGGEEFSILMPEVSYEVLNAVAESIRQSFAEEIFQFDSARVSATVSIGIAMFPNDANTAPQLVRWSDQRLYQAKSQGRNRVIG